MTLKPRTVREAMQESNLDSCFKEMATNRAGKANLGLKSVLPITESFSNLDSQY